MTKQTLKEHISNIETIGNLFYDLNNGGSFKLFLTPLITAYKSLDYEIVENHEQTPLEINKNQTILEKNLLKLAALLESNPVLNEHMISWSQTKNGGEAFKFFIETIGAVKTLEKQEFLNTLEPILLNLEKPLNSRHLEIEKYVQEQFHLNGWTDKTEFSNLIVNLSKQADLVTDEELPFYQESIKRHTMFYLKKGIAAEINYESIILKTASLSFETNFEENLKLVIGLSDEKQMVNYLSGIEIQKKLIPDVELAKKTLNTFANREYYISKENKFSVEDSLVTPFAKIFSDGTFIENNNQYFFSKYIPTTIEESSVYRFAERHLRSHTVTPIKPRSQVNTFNKKL